LDVDVLFLDDEVVSEPDLQIPHPRWKGRLFVVIPLVDVDPGWVDPETGWTVDEVARRAGWTKDSLERVASPDALLPVEIP
jgi:2-amino-4-hydroxy-6-hydroxymethyldihydropteridine diphosphokinase